MDLHSASASLSLADVLMKMDKLVLYVHNLSQVWERIEGSWLFWITEKWNFMFQKCELAAMQCPVAQAWCSEDDELPDLKEKKASWKHVKKVFRTKVHGQDGHGMVLI